LEIGELIGQGGMGFVFKARQPKLDRFVALKILPQSLAVEPAFAERFTREGRLLARLNHPNIVTVHDFGQANGFFYLLMEFVDGVNLRQAMKAARFTSDQALGVVPRICEALQYAHNEGVLHRDIKPENILLDTKGRVKIADFGIAKLLGESQAADAKLTESGGRLGTAHYMAPEQIEKPSEVDHRADIYSLGVVFYEMLTGELPLGRFAPPSEKSASDPRLDDVVLRALDKEPGRRPQSAGEMKTQVETIATSASNAAAVAPGAEPARMRRVAILFIVAGAMGLLPSLLSFGTNQFNWDLGSLLAFTGIALLTRKQIWRMVALACNTIALIASLWAVAWMVLVAVGGKLPTNWSIGVTGLWNNVAVTAVLGLLQLLGFVGGTVLLCQRKVRTLFGSRTGSRSEPELWRKAAAVLAPILVLLLPFLVWKFVEPRPSNAAADMEKSSSAPKQTQLGSLKMIGSIAHKKTAIARTQSVPGYGIHEVIARFAGPELPDEHQDWGISGPVLVPTERVQIDGDWPSPMLSSVFGTNYSGVASSVRFLCPGECQLQFAFPNEELARDAAGQISKILAQPLRLVLGERTQLFRVGDWEGWIEPRKFRPLTDKFGLLPQFPPPFQVPGSNCVESIVATIPSSHELEIAAIESRNGGFGSVHVFEVTLTSPSDQPGLYWFSGYAPPTGQSTGWELVIHDASTGRELHRFRSPDGSGAGWKPRLFGDRTSVGSGKPVRPIIFEGTSNVAPGAPPSPMVFLEMTMRPRAQRSDYNAPAEAGRATADK